MLWKSRFFLLICDHKNIYLGFRCFDTEPQKIKASVSKRDNPGNDDWIAFCLDTFNDELGAYFFLVNPLGIQTDGTLNADADVTLDMVWTSAGRLTTDGYVAEMAIPFKSLRFPSKKNLVMGFKMARNISRKSEEVDFPEYRPERGAALAQFQKIELSGIKKKQLLEMLPATTVSKKHLHQEGSLASPGANKEFSLTSKFGISSGLILDATYHPDFSQVETDAGQIDVNLRYLLYYPEKRSFFMEGQEWFAFAASPEQLPLRTVVHTRNIVQPCVGMKLTGKISSKDIISAIYAQDDYDRKAHVSLPRYLRRLKNDSYLGGFYTGRNMSGAYNYVVGSAGCG